MKYGPVLITTLLLVLPGYGDTPPRPNIRVTPGALEPRREKPAWEWSDDERIQLRFDPIAIRERAAAHTRLAQPRTQPQAAEQTRTAQEYVIDGSRDAELFLPVELLDVLMQGLDSDASIRTSARAALANGIKEMGLTENDFWSRLGQISEGYRALLAKPRNVTIHRVQTSDGMFSSFPIDIDRCVARNALLQSARTSFGTRTFQRFLYTAVAPEVKRVVTTQQSDPKQELLFIAHGCRQ